MLNLETTLGAALEAAKEAHHGGYANGMQDVLEHIEEAIEAIGEVFWGDLEDSVFPDIEEEGL